MGGYFGEAIKGEKENIPKVWTKEHDYWKHLQEKNKEELNTINSGSLEKTINNATEITHTVEKNDQFSAILKNKVGLTKKYLLMALIHLKLTQNFNIDTLYPGEKISITKKSGNLSLDISGKKRKKEVELFPYNLATEDATEDATTEDATTEDATTEAISKSSSPSEIATYLANYTGVDINSKAETLGLQKETNGIIDKYKKNNILIYEHIKSNQEKANIYKIHEKIQSGELITTKQENKDKFVKTGTYSVDFYGPNLKQQVSTVYDTATQKPTIKHTEFFSVSKDSENKQSEIIQTQVEGVEEIQVTEVSTTRPENATKYRYLKKLTILSSAGKNTIKIPDRENPTEYQLKETDGEWSFEKKETETLANISKKFINMGIDDVITQAKESLTSNERNNTNIEYKKNRHVVVDIFYEDKNKNTVKEIHINQYNEGGYRINKKQYKKQYNTYELFETEKKEYTEDGKLIRSEEKQFTEGKITSVKIKKVSDGGNKTETTVQKKNKNGNLADAVKQVIIINNEEKTETTEHFDIETNTIRRKSEYKYTSDKVYYKAEKIKKES